MREYIRNNSINAKSMDTIFFVEGGGIIEQEKAINRAFAVILYSIGKSVVWIHRVTSPAV